MCFLLIRHTRSSLGNLFVLINCDSCMWLLTFWGRRRRLPTRPADRPTCSTASLARRATALGPTARAAQGRGREVSLRAASDHAPVVSQLQRRAGGRRAGYVVSSAFVVLSVSSSCVVCVVVVCCMCRRRVCMCRRRRRVRSCVCCRRRVCVLFCSQ